MYFDIFDVLTSLIAVLINHDFASGAHTSLFCFSSELTKPTVVRERKSATPIHEKHAFYKAS